MLRGFVQGHWDPTGDGDGDNEAMFCIGSWCDSWSNSTGYWTRCLISHECRSSEVSRNCANGYALEGNCRNSQANVRHHCHHLKYQLATISISISIVCETESLLTLLDLQRASWRVSIFWLLYLDTRFVYFKDTKCTNEMQDWMSSTLMQWWLCRIT